MRITRNLIAFGWVIFALALAYRFVRPDSLTFLSSMVGVYAAFTLTKATFIYSIIKVYTRKILQRSEDNATE